MSSDNVYILSFTAAEDIALGTPVKLSGTSVVGTAAGTDDAIGICTADCESGKQAAIAVDGITKCLVNGSGTAIARGDELMPGDNLLVKAATGAANRVVARALQATSGNGALIDVVYYSGHHDTLS